MIRLLPTSRKNDRARPARSAARWCIGLALAATLITAPAQAAPSAGAFLLFDARTGEVIAKKNADQAWYPASITKLMTTWVTLQAIRAGRITPSTLVPMTPNGARQPPSKMGFKPGEAVTVDNALKIIMVKSANDVAWALGETVGGSKEAFVAEMNRQARMLGMTESHWNNPNGLPDPMQVSTARDLGLLARALLREFPEADELWHLPGIQYNNETVLNHNHLINHYPGADGMKTGFICSSGFNVVATATRGNRRLVAVVLGSKSARQRAELAAELFTNGFENVGGGGIFGRFSAPETLDQMARGPEAGNPVRDVKQEICGKKRNEAPDPEEYGAEAGPRAADMRDPGAIVRPGAPEAQPRRASYLTQRFDPGPPVRVWLGGTEAAPPDAGGMLALAPDPSIARVPLFAVPTTPVELPPGLTARAGQPATGPGAGAGLGATLNPADGKPLSLGAGAPAKKATTAARPPEPAAAKPKPTAKHEPKKPEAKKPAPAKPAATAKVEPKPAKPPAAKPAPAKKPKHDDN